MPFPTLPRRALLPAITAAATLLAVLAGPAQAADRTFTQRFAATDTGDIANVGNTSLTCPTSNAQCPGVRAGTTGGSAAQNDQFNMTRVDVDSDTSTQTSSSATLTVPAGATVLWAGLYWGGISNGPSGARDQVLLKPPGGSYSQVDATQFDTTTSDAKVYQGFANVTTAVRAAGSGSYTVGDVSVNASAGSYGGWSLVVAYRDANAPRHNLFVYDGLQPLSNTGTTSLTLPVSGLTTPTTGTVDLDLGLIAYDGDRGLTTDSAVLNTTTVSDALNPADNPFNSTIGTRGTRFTAKNPDYVDQLGFDADVIGANGALAPGSSTASLALNAGNDAYTVGMLSFVTESETDPPETTLTSGPSGPTNVTTPTFAFTSSEAGSTFECRIDNASWFSCTSPHTPPAFAEGAHTFDVRGIDLAGNVDPTPASRSFTVDVTPPQTTITSGPSGLTSSATPTFGLSSSETGSTFQCRVDTGAWTSCTSPFTTGTLSDGAHTFDAKATDAAGNVDATPASRSFTVDATAPDTTITSGPSGVTATASPAFAFTATEAGSTFECRIDGGAWTACTSPRTLSALADGAHTFDVRATDTAGNVDATPASRSFTVDTTAPQTTIDSGPSGLSNAGAPAFTFSADEPGATFECRVDGGAWASCTSPRTLNALADGPHTLDVRATDAAGNTDPTPASRSFTRDTTPPQTTIDSGPNGPTGDATPDFAFSADQAGSTFECRVDGGAWTSCTSPITLSTLADGDHTFDVRAIDTAGNTDATPATRSFTVDTRAPDTTITAGPSGPTNVATPTFGFSADETPATFECRVDGGAWASCTSPHTTASLADGPHTLDARAIDAAGNVDATPASRSFTVDTAAPDTTVDSGPSGATNDATPTFAFSTDQPGPTFECRVDGGAWTACTTPETTAALGDGQHTFEVRAVDDAGNADATPATRTFTVDTAAPQTTIDSGPAGPTNDTAPEFALSANEADSTFECRVDAGAWAACTTPHTTDTLAEGDHTIEVRATDPAGNTDPTPASRSFTVDTTAPDTTISSGPTGLTGATPAFAFGGDEPGSTFECRIDGGSWTSCDTPYTTASLADGDHTFDVRAIDAAGNVDPTPASRQFTVDTAAAQTSITAGPAGPTNDATPTFEFEADEPGLSFECRIDGGAWVACVTPQTTATLADGDHTFEVRSIDSAGNADPTPASRSFTVDTGAPDTTIASGPGATPTADATPDFGLTSDELGATFECRLDGGAWTACTTPHTTDTLTDGPHTLEARATDLAGNTDPTPATRSFTVDASAPQTTIDAGPAGPTNDATPDFTFPADEPGTTFECRVDAGAWAACTTPHTLAALADGGHTFEVRATDAAGNTDPTPAVRTFTVDTSGPDTTIDAGPAATTSDATPELAFSADQTGSTFECRIDAGAWTACTSPHTTDALGDGPHTFEVRATDTAGNVDPTPASRGFTVDAAVPDTTIDAGPAGPTNDSTPEFAFSADEPGATFECRVDGGAWFACTTLHTTASLADGAHTFDVRATDPAGNTDATPATRSFTVDTAAPETTIDSGPGGPTNDATPDFTFSADQTGSTFECRIDGGAWVACTSPHTTAALADGDHTFDVRATDPAGNADATPATRSFTVDTAAPDTSIDSGPSGTTTDATPTFDLGATETGSSFECRVDAGAWAPCATPFTAATLIDGPHTLEARATDAAANTDATPAARSFTVDTGAPATTITGGPSGPTTDATPTFTFTGDELAVTFECRVDGGAWVACTSPYAPASVADGDHLFEVRATDTVGNVEATPARRSFTVDTAAPQTTIASGPSGTTDDDTPTFELASDDPGARFDCRIDGGAWVRCPSPFTAGSLSDGEHTLEVRAVDAAGNADASPASRTFRVSRPTAPPTTPRPAPVAPVVTVRPPADNAPAPAFTLSADQTATSYLCRVDGAAYAPCGPTFIPSGTLAEGSHRLDVIGVAANGLRSAPVSVTFQVGAGCAGTDGFVSASLRGAGHALQVRFVRRIARPVRADVFQVSVGRTVLRERLIARYGNLQRSQTWPGTRDSRGRPIADGYYFVRLSIPMGGGRTDTRRLVVQRTGGRWVARPGYYGRPICGLVSSYKLERPVFGGIGSTAARLSFRLATAARVTVEVRRGGKVVKRLAGQTYAAGRTVRLSLPVKGLRAGLYEFRLTAVAGGRRAVVTASGRRL